MKMTPTLKTALIGLAGAAALSGSACKPVQEVHKEKVGHILESVQPTEEVLEHSKKYYESRHDLSHLRDSGKIASLVFSHAKLSMLAEQLKTGHVSLQDFLTILQSGDRIITDHNTKLKISTNTGTNIGNITGTPNELEIFTEAHSPNLILKNPILSQVVISGGELHVVIIGDGSEYRFTGDKGDIFARDEGKETPIGRQKIDITASLVLAK